MIIMIESKISYCCADLYGTALQLPYNKMYRSPYRILHGNAGGSGFPPRSLNEYRLP